MIGKITTGGNFKNLIDYVLKPSKEPEIIGGNYYLGLNSTIAEVFEEVAKRRPSTTKPVKHIVISFAPQDGYIDLRTKYQIAQKIVSKLGYDNNQWLAVNHQRDDPDHQEVHDHDHMHIVVNMITYSGIRVRDGCDKKRLMGILRNLEKEHQLNLVKSPSDRKRRRPQQGRYKKFETAYYNFDEDMDRWKKNPHQNTRPKPPREPEIQELETFIAAAVSDQPSLSLYLARMQALGYRVEEYEGKASKKTGKIRKRFRYYLKCNQKPIYKVNGGSRAQLIKMGVSYRSERDDPNLIKASKGIPIILDNYQSVTNQMVEQERYNWLTQSKQSHLKTTLNNGNHQINHYQDELETER